MPRPIGSVLLMFSAMMLGACASPSPVAFQVIDASGNPVAGAHARIILLDAGAPLPLSKESLEEAAVLKEPAGGITDREGRVVLPVMGNREHLIEVEGLVLGGDRQENIPSGMWVYRPSDGSIVRSGQFADGLRVRRIE